ncbi:unnamed protein product [Trypanosoma congolense IL3000]|uniref:WGS project CAEQ00000000 data, annotated contig 694 n=1 Tax=Trypanosoma congolense (strain IL3000) TaxID=1068625 RepID=F9WHT5_TRYCI|nr:unnamed protein product [Trypanosoma congolense IL3000]
MVKISIVTRNPSSCCIHTSVWLPCRKPWSKIEKPALWRQDPQTSPLGGWTSPLAHSSKATRETSDRSLPATCYTGSDNNDIYSIGDDTKKHNGDFVKNIGKYMNVRFSLSNTQDGGIGNSGTLENVNDSGVYVKKKSHWPRHPMGNAIFAIKCGDQS